MTVIVLVMPPPVTVMVADRVEVVVLADTETVILALLDPDDLLTEHQLLFVETVHDTFEEMLNDSFPCESENDRLLGFTVK